MSLGYTSDILSNGNIASRYNNISLKSFDIDGHNYDEINEILNYINLLYIFLIKVINYLI